MASFLDELLGKVPTLAAPTTPGEAADPTRPRNQYDPAHPLVGTGPGTPLTPPPPALSLEGERLVAEAVYERFGARLDALHGVIETLVTLQREMRERNIPVQRSVTIP